METIQIVLASDVNYFPGLLVTAVTMARHAAHEVALVFQILDGGIGSENLAFLKRKLDEAHPHAQLVRHVVDETQFADFPEWNEGSRMTYARLMVPELLNATDWVLYCDVDFLWTADVAELWSLRDENCTVQAAIDGWPMTAATEGAWYKANGISVDLSRYICAGMLLVNVRRFRAEGLSRKLMEFLKRHPDVPFVDQTAINAVVRDIGLLPRKWGKFSRSTQREELPGDWAIHYAGTAPWTKGWWTHEMSDAHVLWYEVYAELTGLGYWAAVRRFLPRTQYFRRRLTWIIATHPVLRTLFFILLRVCNRACYIPEIRLIGKR